MKAKKLLITLSTITLGIAPLIAASCSSEAAPTTPGTRLSENDQAVVNDIDKISKEITEIQNEYFQINEYISNGKLSTFNFIASNILGRGFDTAVNNNSLMASIESLKTIAAAETSNPDLMKGYDLFSQRLSLFGHNLGVAKEEIEENKNISSTVSNLISLKDKLEKGEQVSNTDFMSAITALYRVTQDKIFNHQYFLTIQDKQIKKEGTELLPQFGEHVDSHVHILGNVLLDFHIVLANGIDTIKTDELKMAIEKITDTTRKQTATRDLENIEKVVKTLRDQYLTGANINKGLMLVNTLREKVTTVVTALKNIATIRGVSLVEDTRFTPAREDHDHDHDHDHGTGGMESGMTSGMESAPGTTQTTPTSGDHDHDHDHDHESGSMDSGSNTTPTTPPPSNTSS